MCVANGTKDDNGIRVQCPDPGDPRLYGFCGWCWSALPDKQRERLTAVPPAPPADVRVVNRYTSGVPSWFAWAAVALAYLAGVGTSAVTWWVRWRP
jgi:hypothetical protein